VVRQIMNLRDGALCMSAHTEADTRSTKPIDQMDSFMESADFLNLSLYERSNDDGRV
jgi:hypothetical protein